MLSTAVKTQNSWKELDCTSPNTVPMQGSQKDTQQLLVQAAHFPTVPIYAHMLAKKHFNNNKRHNTE